jgi:chromosome segregation ATPase
LKKDFALDTVAALKEGVSKIAVDTQLFKRDVESWKGLAEGLQEKVQKLQSILSTRPTADAYKNVMDQTKKVKEMASIKEQELLGKVQELESQISKRSLMEKRLVSELKKISEEKQVVLEENKTLKTHARNLMTKLQGISEQEKARQTALAESVAQQEEIHIHPQSSFSTYRVNPKVQEYYADLVRRYGKDIIPFKERILGCKTVREAAMIHLDALTSFGRNEYAVLSEALPVAERRKLIESQTRVRIPERSLPALRKPETWE